MLDKTKLNDFRYRITAALFNKYERFIWRFRYQFIPFLIKASIILLVGSFIGASISLTVKGLGYPFTDEYKELFSVVLATTGTVVAIYFSLVLIPLEQISKRYSPRFLEYLKNDHVFAVSFLYCFSSIAFNTYFLFAGASRYIAIASALQVVFLFVVLYWLWRWSIRLSNPQYSVLLPEQNRISKAIKKEITRTTKRQIRNLKALPGEARTLNDRIGYFKVDDSVLEYLKSNLLPIREVAMKAIKNGELEQAQNAIGAITAIVLNYLTRRKEYYSDDDPLMYFIYQELTLLADSSATKELKIQLHPFIANCWRNIALKASVVNIKRSPRMNNNVNSLVHYPVQGLKHLYAINLPESDATTPGDVCRALGDVGVSLMKEGYDHQAASIIQDLEKMSLLADAANIGVFSGSANYAIMRVYIAGLAWRNNSPRDGHNYVFGLIDTSLRNLIDKLLQKKRDTFGKMVIGSFIGWITDPFKGINLSRTTEYALFSDGLTKDSLALNMEAINNNIEYLEIAINHLKEQKDYFFSGQAYENLYLTMFALLSYLNNNMAEDHIMYYKEEPNKDEKLVNKAEILFGKCIDILIQNAAQQTNSHGMPGRDYLDILTSIYLIVLYETKKQQNHSLDKLFLDLHKKIKELLDSHVATDQGSANSNLTKHLRLIRTILWNNRYYVRARELRVPDFEYNHRGNSFMFESEYPEAMVGRDWHLTRPTFQKNGYYYNEVEKSLGLRSDS